VQNVDDYLCNRIDTLQISHCTVKNYLTLYCIKYSPYQKLLQIKGTDLNEIYICHMHVFLCHKPLLKKVIKLNLRDM